MTSPAPGRFDTPSETHDPAEGSAGPDVAPGATRTRWLVLAVVSLAQLMIALDTTVVNIALPSAQSALEFSNGNRQWIVTAYALAFGSLLLLGGRLGDMLGRRTTFLLGLVGFAAASALGGAAQNFEMLVAARAAQGVFAALLAPAALSLLSVTFTDPDERAKAFAVFGAIAAGGGAVGLILGGALTEYVSWRWSLYVNIPIAAVAAAGALAFLSRSERRDTSAGIDLTGTVTVSAGLVALVYGLSKAETDGWSATSTVAFIVAGLTLLAVFVLIESRTKTPLLPLNIVWDRNRGAAFLTVSVIGVGLFAVFLFLTYYAALILGYSALKTGFAFAPLIVAIMVAATVAAGPSARLGPRVPVLTGMIIAAAGLALLAQLGLDSSYLTHILPGLLVTGVGVGIAMAPAFSAATSGVGEEHAGVASASVNTFQQIGGSIGVAVLSALASSAASDHLAGRRSTQANLVLAELHSYTTVFWWAAGILAVGGVVAGLLFSRNQVADGTRPAGDPGVTHL